MRERERREAEKKKRQRKGKGALRSPEELVHFVRNETNKREGGLAGLARVFRMRDKDRSGALDATELSEALRVQYTEYTSAGLLLALN